MSKSDNPAYNAIIRQYQINKFIGVNNTFILSGTQYHIIKKLIRLAIAELILDNVDNTSIDQYIQLDTMLNKQYENQDYDLDVTYEDTQRAGDELDDNLPF
jgi:hypothetical protein